jgi:hypothetical protein
MFIATIAVANFLLAFLLYVTEGMEAGFVLILIVGCATMVFAYFVWRYKYRHFDESMAVANSGDQSDLDTYALEFNIDQQATLPRNSASQLQYPRAYSDMGVGLSHW